MYHADISSIVFYRPWFVVSGGYWGHNVLPPAAYYDPQLRWLNKIGLVGMDINYPIIDKLNVKV